MTVAADERAVKPDLAHVKRRHGSKLRREEVLLRDAVHIVENAHHSKLHPVLAVVGIGRAADEDIKPLAREALGHGFFHLVGGEVGQQIGYDELRLTRLAPDDDIDGLPILQCDSAVQLQRDGDPLVFLYAAVVVRLEIAHFVRLVHSYLLEIKARRVHVRPGDNRAVGKRLFADDGEHQRLAAVVLIELHPRLYIHSGHILCKAVLLGEGDGVYDSLALHAGAVEKVHILPAILLYPHALIGVDKVIAVLLLVKELFSQFTHFPSTSVNSFRQSAENSSRVPLFLRI